MPDGPWRSAWRDLAASAARLVGPRRRWRGFGCVLLSPGAALAALAERLVVCLMGLGGVPGGGLGGVLAACLAESWRRFLVLGGVVASLDGSPGGVPGGGLGGIFILSPGAALARLIRVA